MSRTAFLPLFLCLSLLIQCSKNNSPDPQPDPDPITQPGDNTGETDPEPDPIVYFTLEAMAPKFTNALEEWIVVHDANGALLDYSRFNTGDLLEFESVEEVTSKLSVTTVSQRQDEIGNETYVILTTTSVDRGSNWSFGVTGTSTAQPVQYTDNGTFTFEITDIPDILKLNLSSENRRYITFGPANNSRFERTFDAKIEEPEYFVSLLDGLGQLKYYSFINENVEDISVPYASLMNFDSYVEVTLPDYNTYYLNVAAFKDDAPYHQFEGIWLHDILSPLDAEISTQPLIFGYLDRFTKYRTLFSVQTDVFSYGITQYGPKMETLEIPDPTFEITDPSRSSFRYSLDIIHEEALPFWSKSEGNAVEGSRVNTQWTLVIPANETPMVGEIPQEILEALPAIDVDGLQYSGINFNLPQTSTEFLSRHSLTIYP